MYYQLVKSLVFLKSEIIGIVTGSQPLALGVAAQGFSLVYTMQGSLQVLTTSPTEQGRGS